MLLGPSLAVSAVLFALGVAGVLLRRNAIVIFMCVELMLNAVNLTFVALAQSLGVAGQIFVFFVMAVAAAEAAGGPAVIPAIYPPQPTGDPPNINLVKGREAEGAAAPVAPPRAAPSPGVPRGGPG